MARVMLAAAAVAVAGVVLHLSMVALVAAVILGTIVLTLLSLAGRP
jgi:hypothetical protein